MIDIKFTKEELLLIETVVHETLDNDVFLTDNDVINSESILAKITEQLKRVTKPGNIE